MKLAHVREKHSAKGSPWRLVAALDEGRWLDLDLARRRLVARDPELAHNSPVFRLPVTTLDDHLGTTGAGPARGRVADLWALVDPFVADAGRAAFDDDLVLDAADLRFGPPILRPPSFRDFYAFEQHVGTMWKRRGGEIPEAWYRIPVFYFSNVSEMRGPEDPVWAPRGSAELDYELEVGALVDVAARDLPADRAEEAIGGFFIINDWSARDLQREETTVRLGPAKGKDFATSIGPMLVTPDELVDVRRPGATAPDLAMTATVNGKELSRGNWATAQFSFGQMLARASSDVTLRPGDIFGSGTVGFGCLLEIGAERFGRWLEPGDEVVLSIERLGELRTPIIDRPAGTS